MRTLWTPPERRRETETVTSSIVYEPVLQDATERQKHARRRDEWKDAVHRGGYAVVVVMLAYLLLLLFWEVPNHLAPIAIVLAIIFTLWPMFNSLQHRSRTQATHRALDELRHAQNWERGALALQRSQHSRVMFGIEAQTQTRQLAHREEQRAMNTIDNRDMDAQHFLDAVRRGESPSKRSWTGRTLPSGQKMTAAKWSEITANMETQGILARDGPGTPYRLVTAPSPAGVNELPEDAICTLPR